MNTRIVTFANKTSTDLTGKEGYAVKFDTDGVALCSAITDQAIGVVTKGGTTSSEVAVQGETQGLAGGTVTRGKYLIPHTDGTVKDTAASSQEFALALEDAVAGDVFTLLVLGAPKTRS